MNSIVAHLDAIKYATAFGFGALIIFFFASRRIEQLTAFPEGEEFQILRLLSTAAIGGRRASRRAFIYYCLLLELIFALLCILQPVANALIGPLKEFKFDDVSWPFGAALVVVGLLPATPAFEQIELAFRRFAHSAAGIPEGFLLSIARIEKSSLKEKIIGDPALFSEEIERYNELNNITTAAGFPIKDSQYIAQADLFLGLFHGWTLAPQSSTVWSAGARATFFDVTGVTSARVIRLREDIAQMVKYSLATNYIAQLKKELKLKDLKDQIDPQLVRKSNTYDQDEDRREVFDRWDPKIKDITLAAKQLVAMFVLFAANDSRPNSDDAYFKEAARLAWREQSKPLYNAAVGATVGGFLTALVTCSLISTAFAFFSEGKQLVLSITEGVYSGALASVSTSIQCGAALIVAIAIYYSRDLQFRYGLNTTTNTVPVTERVSFLAYSALTACAISLIMYIVYQLWDGKLTSTEALDTKELTRRILFIVGWSVIPGILGLGCTMIADSLAQKKSVRLYAVSIVVLTAAAAFVILVLALYDITKAPFWTQMGTVVGFIPTCILLFLKKANTQPQ